MRNRFKESFVSGLILFLPLIITLLLINFLAGWVFKLINPIVRGTNLTQYTGEIDIIAQIIAFSIVLAFITLTGYLSRYQMSSRLRNSLSKVAKNIPVFGAIYAAIKQISSSFTGKDDRFKKVVMIEFPRENIYSIGLLTSESPKTMEEKSGNEELESVYIPMSPNPTMGRTVMVEPSEIEDLDMTIPEAMKLMLTTGMAYKEEDMPERIQESRY